MAADNLPLGKICVIHATLSMNDCKNVRNAEKPGTDISQSLINQDIISDKNGTKSQRNK